MREASISEFRQLSGLKFEVGDTNQVAAWPIPNNPLGTRQAFAQYVPGLRKQFFCLVSIILLTDLQESDAKPPRHTQETETEFVAPFQPFSLEPTIPRAVAVETKIAYNAPRAVPVPDRVPRASEMDDEDSDQDWDREETSDDQDDDDSSDSENQRHANGPIVPGKRAILRNGIAYAPARAPFEVKQAIWAANTLRRKPYVWGGGHRSFYDRGYDCSGAVSFALHAAGVLGAPLPSDDLMRFGKRGRGRWITIYSRRGHTFAVIAGLRFDTTDLGHGGDVGPRWYVTGRSTRGFAARHPAGL